MWEHRGRFASPSHKLYNFGPTKFHKKLESESKILYTAEKLLEIVILNVDYRLCKDTQPPTSLSMPLSQRKDQLG